MVLGHEGCGAVKAALSSKLHDVQHQSRIQILVDNMLPGLAGLKAHLSEEAQLADAVEANVRWSMHQLAESPEGKAALHEGRATLVGAVYEISTGRVRYLSKSS
jgi:carbonic anhydrase